MAQSVTPQRVARFARWAADYDASQLQRFLYEPVHRRVLRKVRRVRPTRILDVGCGTGRLAAALSARYPDVPTIGIDPCAEMLHRAIAHPTVTCLCARAEALPFRDGLFDLVLSTFSLRHWDDPRQGLAELRRVTAPGGLVVIADAALDDVLGPPRELRRVLRHEGLRLDDASPIALPASLVTLVTARAPAHR